MNKLVSVIIAAYNSQEYIEQSVNSIRNQTYSNLEIIICDDCSTDRTFEILTKLSNEDGRIKLLRNGSNMFAAYSRNRCIEVANGEYIAIQDADDISSEKRIEKLVAALENSEYDFVSSGESLFDVCYTAPYRYVTHKHSPTKKDFLRGMCFCHAATLIKKSVLLSVGGYPVDKKIHRHEDYMLFMNLYGEGYRGFNIDDCLYYYRVDESAIKRRGWKTRLQECRIRYRGFKKMKILPIGLPFVFVPLVGYFVQSIKNMFKRL